MAEEQATKDPHQLGSFATLRQDRWWLEPALVFMGLSLFFGYLTVSAFLDGWEFEIGPYLSPVFEPKLHGSFDAWWFSPAFLIFWAPAGFRATCYYYRRAYYRSYFLSPPACAVGDAIRLPYKGESRFPFSMQQIHRFFLYVALVFVPLLWIGAVKGFHDPEDGWGVGVGSFILVGNAFLLTMYAFSCHSFRHIIGGGLDCFSCSFIKRARKKIWDYVSVWNANHRAWAWVSLIGVVSTDIYIRLVANHHITDPNTWSSF